jgi:flagellar hook-associated protein 3
MRVANDVPDILASIQQSQQVLQTDLQQVATGQRVNQPSDDPAASAKLAVSLAASAQVDQYTQNISDVSTQLQTADSALSSVVTSLTSAVSLGTEGANGTSSTSDKQGIATQVQAILSNVVSQANTTYQGSYVFGGSSTATAPVQQAAAVYLTQNAQIEPPLTATLPLTAGSTTVVTDPATGKTFVFTVTAGETISDLTTAIAGAASSGALPAATTATIDNGQLKISSGSSTDGIVVTSNDPVLGSFAAVSGTEIPNTYAYTGNSTVNSVQVGDSLSVATNIQTATQAVSTALNNLSQARVPFENGLTQLNSQESFLSQEKVTLGTQQTKLVGADLATTATNLAQAQVQNQAVLAAAARVVPQTLLNYLTPPTA